MSRTAIVLNALAYQLVWFASVLGAGDGRWWPGPLAALAFAALHFGFAVRNGLDRRRDLVLLAAAVICGLLIDGALSMSGAVVFAAHDPALPSGGAPLWMLTLWASFALTLRHSLRAVTARPVLAALLAALLGAVGGPLAYLGAARAAGAVFFREPATITLAMLAVGWCLALGLLAMFASRPMHAAPAPHTPLTGGAA